MEGGIKKEAFKNVDFRKMHILKPKETTNVNHINKQHKCDNEAV